MRFEIKKFHTVTVILFILTLLIIEFLTNNFILLLGFTVFLSLAFTITGSVKKYFKTLYLFIPLMLLTIFINLFFSSEGGKVIFIVFRKSITIEAIIFSIDMSLKLFSVIYTFMLLDICIDSDRALSYFSGKLPKSTLLLLICVKLFPNLKNRMNSIKEVYAIRGINYEAKKISLKLFSYMPVLSVLLESSLEGAFDIAEASYVRGFLSTERSIYDKQNFESRDISILLLITLLLLSYIISLFIVKNIDIYLIMLLFFIGFCMIFLSRVTNNEID